MVQPKPLAGCVDQSSAHLSFLPSSSFTLKLCPPDGHFSFTPILSSFSFFLSRFFKVLPVSTYQYLRYLPVLPCQYSTVPADRRQVQPQEAALQPLQAADLLCLGDRRQVQPLEGAAVHPSIVDGRLQLRLAAGQEDGEQQDLQGGAQGRGEEREVLRKSQITPALELSSSPPVQCSQPALRRNELTASQAKSVQSVDISIFAINH